MVTINKFLVLEYLHIIESYVPPCRGGVTCTRLWSITSSSALYVWFLRACSLQPGTFTAHRCSWLNTPTLCGLHSHCLLLSTTLVCFGKKTGYTSANETTACLTRPGTVWRLGLSGTHTMKGRCSLSVKFSILLQSGRLAWIIEKIIVVLRKSVLVIFVTML